MSNKTAVSAIACAPGTLPGGPVRTRFFDGMFLTQADLENEQRYWRLKRRLTNRALGEGVVWGLRLGRNKADEITLSPGYGLDCCGNDLVVECPVEVSMRELWSRADPALHPPAVAKQPGGDGRARPHAEARRDDGIHACIVLQYIECPEEARPVHRDACAGPTGVCEPSRIRESTRLLLVPPPVRPRPSPPEQFLDELEALRDGITDPALRDLLFPPQTPAPPTTSGNLPLTLRVTVPGTPAASGDASFPPAGTGPGPSLLATQTPAADRRTGVVTFQLLPSSGWQLVGGRVLDQGRTVESVTPPASPSMYWALDVALPPGVASTTTRFEFVLDGLEMGPVMGTAATGRLAARVSGLVRVQAVTAGLQVQVTELQLITERAEGFPATAEGGCLRELLPWGWTVDPADGARIARTLLLSGIYAMLSELVARNSRYQLAASYLYAIAWYALFGVNPTAPVPDALKRQLTALITRLYERWCNGLVYPGPRCSDEHHGIYLGCVVLNRDGSLRSLDGWQHRRHVLTGPLIEHWMAQSGIAPLDVIVGRFARALCCLSGVQPIALPTRPDDLQPGLGRASERFHVGNNVSVLRYAEAYKTAPTWVPLEQFAARFVEAMRAGDGRQDGFRVYATVVEDGGRVAVAVPEGRRATPEQPGAIRGTAAAALRRSQPVAPERARVVTAEYTERVLATAPVSAVVTGEPGPELQELLSLLGKRGVTAADLVGSDAAALASMAAADPRTFRDTAAELIEMAETSVERIALTTLEALGRSVDRATLADPGRQKRLTEALIEVQPNLEPQLVVAAAEATARS